MDTLVARAVAPMDRLHSTAAAVSTSRAVAVDGETAEQGRDGIAQAERAQDGAVEWRRESAARSM